MPKSNNATGLTAIWEKSNFLIEIRFLKRVSKTITNHNVRRWMWYVALSWYSYDVLAKTKTSLQTKLKLCLFISRQKKSGRLNFVCIESIAKKAWFLYVNSVDGIMFASDDAISIVIYASAVQLNCSMQYDRSLCTIHPFRVRSFAYPLALFSGLSLLIGSKAILYIFLCVYCTSTSYWCRFDFVRWQTGKKKLQWMIWISGKAHWPGHMVHYAVYMCVCVCLTECCGKPCEL